MRRRNGVEIASWAGLVLLSVACTSIDYSESVGGAGAGGAAGSGAAATVGGQGGGAAGGGGAVPVADICGNGIDDDLDGFTDCDDPDCTEVCNTLPMGWTGFVSVRATGCSPGEVLAQRAYQSASGSSACGCTCGAPTCGTVVGTAYGSIGCGGGVITDTLGASCSSVGNQGAESVRVTSTDSCGAGAAALLDPSVTSESVDLCTDPRGSCVFKAGAGVPCPPEFPTSSPYDGVVADTRSCGVGSCQCDSPACGVAYLHETHACQGSATALTLGSCVSHNGPAGLTFVADPDPSCTSSGTASASGSVSLSAPITVCCK